MIFIPRHDLEIIIKKNKEVKSANQHFTHTHTHTLALRVNAGVLRATARGRLWRCVDERAERGRSFLFVDGRHDFLGGVVQVLCRGDGQAALTQDPLGLVDVGPWEAGKKKNRRLQATTTVTTTTTTRLNPMCHLHGCRNQRWVKDDEFHRRNQCT